MEEGVTLFGLVSCLGKLCLWMVCAYALQRAAQPHALPTTNGKGGRGDGTCVGIHQRVRGFLKSLVKSWIYTLAGEVRRTLWEHLETSVYPEWKGERGPDMPSLMGNSSARTAGRWPWIGKQVREKPNLPSTCSGALAGLWVWPSW